MFRLVVASLCLLTLAGCASPESVETPDSAPENRSWSWDVSDAQVLHLIFPVPQNNFTLDIAHEREGQVAGPAFWLRHAWVESDGEAIDINHGLVGQFHSNGDTGTSLHAGGERVVTPYDGNHITGSFSIQVDGKDIDRADVPRDGLVGHVLIALAEFEGSATLTAQGVPELTLRTEAAATVRTVHDLEMPAGTAGMVMASGGGGFSVDLAGPHFVYIQAPGAGYDDPFDGRLMSPLAVTSDSLGGTFRLDPWQSWRAFGEGTWSFAQDWSLGVTAPYDKPILIAVPVA